MRIRHLFIGFVALGMVLILQASVGTWVSAQEFPDEEGIEDILPELPESEIFGEEEEAPRRPVRIEPGELGEPGEEENLWRININAQIKLNYVFNNSEDSFIINYRWAITGEANAATAVIRGNADIDVEVEGFLSKGPTFECKLEVTIPKVPFELTFRRTEEEMSNIRLVFKRAIKEAWQSKCTFTDAPGARFNTTGEAEQWLTRALKKARPPLKSIIAELGEEEMSTTSIIPTQIISDAPVGSGEFEGVVQITIGPRYE